MKDKFWSLRQEFKGVFIATKNPNSTKIIASALDYRTLDNILKKKKLSDKPIAIQYLEPKKAICAYGVSSIN